MNKLYLWLTNKNNFSKTKFFLLDLFGGAGVLLSSISLLASNTSSNISLLIVAGSIIPGILLSGFSRSIVLGMGVDRRSFFSNFLISILFNFILLFFYATFLGVKNEMFLLVFIIALSTTSQTLSRVWFYVYGKSKMFLYIKFSTFLIRGFYSALAFFLQELLLILLGNIFVSIIEMFVGILIYSKTNFKKENLIKGKENLIVGSSIGVSRLSSSALKILIESNSHNILSHLLIFEQIAAGCISLFEKYFIRVIHFSPKFVVFKLFFIFLFLLLSTFFLVTNPEHIHKLYFIFFLSLISFLSVYSNYELIRNNGLISFSRSIFCNSFFIFILTFINFIYFKIGIIYLLIYIYLPFLQILINFLFVNNLKIGFTQYVFSKKR